jgi:riboflavin biosynthesis pyrimidine reductase
LSQEWRDRFERFAREKAKAALAASLPPYETEWDAPPGDAAPIGSAWSTGLFDGHFYLSPAAARRPGCGLVFVQSADGNTGAADPSTLGGGSTDKHLIYEGLSRVAADGVLVGSRTLRGHDLVFSVWHPELVSLRSSLGLPRHPVQVVATLQGLPVEQMLLFNVGEIPAVLLTTAQAMRGMEEAVRVRPWVTAILMNGAADLPRAFEQLRGTGITRVSCVGGRTLATGLLDADLVDDVYLTTAPQPGGEPGTPLSPRPWRGRVAVRKHGTGAEAGVVFEHVLPLTITARSLPSTIPRMDGHD